MRRPTGRPSIEARGNRFLANPVVRIVLGLVTVLVGLGWLGVIPGWSNAGSIFATLGGIAFLLVGGGSVFVGAMALSKRL